MSILSPGQIIYIQSTENYFYISVMRSMQQHPVVNDDNRYEINTCCDLCVDVYSGEMYPSTLTFAAGGNGSTWDLDVEFDEIRPAHDFEKKLLFDRLVYEFKLHEPKWIHLTDSTYFDILDWLVWEFDVETSSDGLYQDPIEIAMYEIQDYIWDALCKETGNYQDKTAESEVEDKMVSLNKACKVISEMVQKFCPNLIRCGEDLKYWEDEFRKKLEE